MRWLGAFHFFKCCNVRTDPFFPGGNQPALRPAFSIPMGCGFRFLLCSRGTNGSLKFPDYPYVCMPRSQFPVMSSTLAVTRWRLLPSSKSKLSAFPATTAGYRCFPYRPQFYNFRKSVTRPTHSLHLASYTPYWICTQVHY